MKKHQKYVSIKFELFYKNSADQLPVFYENFAPSRLEKVVDLESDRLANLTLTEEILNNERMVAFEERRLKSEGVPESKMQEVLWQLGSVK